MTQAETALFYTYCKTSTAYFEFGCGGSTVFYNALGKPCKSVENNESWLNKVRPLVGPSTELIYINTGPVKDYGNPVNPAKTTGFADYSLAFSRRHPETDLVLIDGRFRVACALQVVLSGFSGTVLVHDAERLDYWQIFPFFTRIERVENLVALRLKPTADLKEAAALWETYKLNYK